MEEIRNNLFNLDTREIYIYDDIGADTIGATDVLFALRELGPGEVRLRVNSYGGSVDEALAMLEVLKRHAGEITVSVDAIAASAASLFPAVFESTIAAHSRVMIHNPWGVAIGDSAAMRSTADVLDRYTESIVGIYSSAMGLDGDAVKALLDAETWYNAAEAVEAKLVGYLDDDDERTPIAARLCDPKRFKNTPADLLDIETEIETAAPVEQLTPALASARARRVQSLFDMRRKGYRCE
jgi:ATP-dependent protease ClpP protease subunit